MVAVCRQQGDTVVTTVVIVVAAVMVAILGPHRGGDTAPTMMYGSSDGDSH